MVTKLISDNDGIFLANCVKSCTNLEGEIVEVGVFQGGTAEIINSVKDDKNLYLFDTFKGLCECLPIDAPFVNGNYEGNEDSVRNLFLSNNKVIIIKGWFPNSAECLNNSKICFCHLDTDTYESTKGCLKFIYPKLVKDAIMLIHDYPGNFIGIKNAVNEFFSDKVEKPILDGEFYAKIVKE